MGIGFWEIVLIAVVVVLIFGSRRIPEIARSLGQFRYQFKKGQQDAAKLLDDAEAEAEKEAAKPDQEESGDENS